MRYIKPFLENLENNDWQNTPEGLYKKFEFDNFEQAINFIVEISKIIQTQNHHPKIINNYNLVEVYSITHDANKITEKDFNLANLIDDLNTQKPLLTKTEKIVLMLLKQGKSYKEIAEKLESSTNTINFHIKNLYKKYNVNSVAQLLSKFI